ncbi:acyl-CoA thioesterase [Ruminococcaceae bacterium OttesenSCG-928-D13]|nr:acyl-CoA thioesterase [Ruminococcaceae bacterium OttesenSCG-928-D13]
MDKQRRVSDSRTEQIHYIQYKHLNSQRRLFGGMLMEWIDEVAGFVAGRHTGGKLVTTAAVDSLVFKGPAYLGDVVVLVGTLTYTGNTSMEVRVDTFVEEADSSRKRINRAYLVMVAIDEDGKPTKVPPVVPETDEERREWEDAQKRNALRKQRREEKY